MFGLVALLALIGILKPESVFVLAKFDSVTADSRDYLEFLAGTW